MCFNYFSGVDHGTLDQGASLLTSNRLSSAMDSLSRVKGIYNLLLLFLLLFFCSITVKCRNLSFNSVSLTVN